MAVMTVGLISDTHNLMRAQALEALEGVDHILHAGDVCRPGILEALEAIAPVSAIQGNCDEYPLADSLPFSLTLTLADVRILMVHDLKTMAIKPARERIDVVLFGHTHTPLVETRQGILYVNPGSAGPRRFQLPISMAKMILEDGKVRIEPVELEG